MNPILPHEGADQLAPTTQASQLSSPVKAFLGHTANRRSSVGFNRSHVPNSSPVKTSGAGKLTIPVAIKRGSGGRVEVPVEHASSLRASAPFGMIATSSLSLPSSSRPASAARLAPVAKARLTQQLHRGASSRRAGSVNAAVLQNGPPIQTYGGSSSPYCAEGQEQHEDSEPGRHGMPERPKRGNPAYDFYVPHTDSATDRDDEYEIETCPADPDSQARWNLMKVNIDQSHEHRHKPIVATQVATPGVCTLIIISDHTYLEFVRP